MDSERDRAVTAGEQPATDPGEQPVAEPPAAEDAGGADVGGVDAGGADAGGADEALLLSGDLPQDLLAEPALPGDLTEPGLLGDEEPGERPADPPMPGPSVTAAPGAGPAARGLLDGEFPEEEPAGGEPPDGVLIGGELPEGGGLAGGEPPDGVLIGGELPEGGGLAGGEPPDGVLIGGELADGELADGELADGELAGGGAGTALVPDVPLVPDAMAATQVIPAPGRHASTDQWSRLGGRVFGWLTVLPVLLVAAWLLPGLPLLLAGRFLPVPMLLISAPVAALFAVATARYMPGHWPGPAARVRPPSAWAAWLGLAGTAVIAAGFGVWQAMRDSPQLIVVRQPGVFTQLGYWIAQHGMLPIPAAESAFGGGHPGLSFASYGFATHGTTLVPWQLPGFPAVLAAGAWAHGLPGVAAVSPVLGAFAVLAVAGLTGRLAGLAWAPVGALATALTLPEILTSRSAYAEPMVQLLLFGGLCLVADSLTARAGHQESQLLPGPVRWHARLPGTAVLAGLGGLALGLTVLAEPGTLFVLLPVIPFAAAASAGHRPRAASFTIGLVLGTGYGLAGGLLLASPAMAGLSPSLRMIGLAVVWTAALTLAGIAVGYRQRARELLARRPLRWLPEAAAVLVVLTAIAFAVRPYVQVVRTAGGDSYVGWLQQLAGLPADPRRRYAEDSLYWVIWYLGLPAVLLGVAGLALLTRRCLRALTAWRDDGRDVRLLALPLLITGWGALTVLWQPRTLPDQPWASRVLVPVVLPGLVLCAVWAAAWLTARARERGAGIVAVAVAVTFFTAALAVPGAITSFGAGTPLAGAGTRLTVAGVTLGGAAGQETGAGEAAAVSRLCGQIGQQSSVLIVDEAAAREFAPVLRGLCGIPAGVMVGASPGQVLAAAHGIAQAGRRPVLLASSASGLTPFGQPPRKVIDLLTRQDTHYLTRPPDGTWPIRYQAWMSTPATVAGA